MKKGLLFLMFLVGFSFIGQSQVIISQYYEGSSFNKWIEITNPTTATIDLSIYYLCGYNNAAADNPAASSPTNTIALTGTLASGASKLFQHTSATLPSYASGIHTAVCNFNKDDLVIISTSNSGTGAWADRIDVIGDGSTWGENKSFYRNASINVPNTTYTSAEWTQETNNNVNMAPIGTSRRLGEHAITTLPIKLQNFNVISKRNQNILNWQTTTEINNDYMAIERSSDGRRFVELGQVAGSGTTNELKNYSFVDQKPLSGVNYYRLRQVDYNGTASYHKVVSILVSKGDSDIRIVPTAVIDEVMIYLPATIKSAAAVNIYDVTGKLWHRATLSIGSNQEGLNVSHLPNGHYILQVIEGQSIFTVRFNKL